MKQRAAIAILASVLGASASSASPDIPPAYRWKADPGAPAVLPPGQTIPVLPNLEPTTLPQEQKAKSDKRERLKPESRLALVRYIHGEFARAVRPLPSLKKGFRIKAGQPVNEEALRNAGSRTVAANPGDTVQITRIEFREKEIVLDINGGSKERKRLRDRIQVSVGGLPSVQTTQEAQTPGYQRAGATLIIDFDGPVPDITPDEFKAFLSGYLDFSKQRSAAVHWVDTLPPEFQQAIKDKRATVGMDREMVIAAMGRPEHKVRERDAEGMETEDWIYGHPPGKTIFVKFAGEKVIAVREFPR